MTSVGEVDVLIIGAGVVGLAISAEISKSGRTTVLVERNKSFGQETSSRNSEVVHGGMYYPPKTMKAGLCVEGRRSIYAICEDNNIPYRKTGKFIVALQEEEMPSLEMLYYQGIQNGVEGLRILSKKEVNKLEPNISCLAALHSKETGIVDSHRLMQYFIATAEDSGAIIAYNSEVDNISRSSNGYEVLVKSGTDTVIIKTEIIINSAGLDSDKIARMAGIDTGACGYDLHYCRGQYFRISSRKAEMLKSLVYPVPKMKTGGLGVHATLDLGGGVRLGPDAKYMSNRDRDYSVDESKKETFYLSAREFLPFISEEDLYADTCGIRPKLQEEGGEFRDFVIAEESDKGLPGFVNLIGIESPGLTACSAIAKRVKRLLWG